MHQSGAFLVSSEMALFQLMKAGRAKRGSLAAARSDARLQALAAGWHAVPNTWLAHSVGCKPLPNVPPPPSAQDASAPGFKEVSALVREPRTDLLPPGMAMRL